MTAASGSRHDWWAVSGGEWIGWSPTPQRVCIIHKIKQCERIGYLTHYPYKLAAIGMSLFEAHGTPRQTSWPCNHARFFNNWIINFSTSFSVSEYISNFQLNLFHSSLSQLKCPNSSSVCRLANFQRIVYFPFFFFFNYSCIFSQPSEKKITWHNSL